MYIASGLSAPMHVKDGSYWFGRKMPEIYRKEEKKQQLEGRAHLE